MTQPRNLLAAVALAACAGDAAASGCDALGSIEWLLGEWLAEGAKSTWRETWTASGPKTWEGWGVETSRADPARSGTEELRLLEMGGAVFYVAKVSHNELPVAFRLVECGEDRLVFANPAHDFPRRLEYRRQPGGRLSVRVSDGGDKGFTLDFARQAQPSPDAAAVLAAEDARFAAMVAADAAAIRAAFAGDLSYVHSTGEVATREQLVDEIAGGRLRYLALAPGERSVTFPHADIALVNGQARIQAAVGGAQADFQARYLAVYVRDGDAWRLRAWQSARLP